MPEDKGTGKHPHKSSEEPWPHHEKGSSHEESRHRSETRGEQKTRAAGRGGESQSESSDLKQREYKDSQGNIHHHTHSYEEQHKGKK